MQTSFTELIIELTDFVDQVLSAQMVCVLAYMFLIIELTDFVGQALYVFLITELTD